MDTTRFTNRTVVITSASGWMGTAMARRFAAECTNLVLAARRREKLGAMVDEIGDGRALAVTTDVTHEDDVAALMDTAAQRFGGIDILVQNAGTNFPKALGDLTLDDWRFLMATNAESTFLGARAALPHLERSRGSIVNFTRGLAVELGDRGIRVNAIAPTLTVDNTLASTPGVDVWLDKAATRQALPGHATPDDVAAAAAFLASDDARFITGVILPLDGGVTAHSGQAEFL